MPLVCLPICAVYANADLRNKLDGRMKIDKYTYDWGVNAP